MKSKVAFTRISAFALTAIMGSFNDAKSSTLMYKFDHIPDVEGVILHNNRLDVVLGQSSSTKDAANLYKKVIAFPSAGGIGCKKLATADAGVYWTNDSCVHLKRLSLNHYSLDIRSRFQYKDESPDDWQVLKNYDLVRQRSMKIDFSYDSSACSAFVKSRNYVPVDVKKVVQSRTGSIGCVIVPSQ